MVFLTFRFQISISPLLLLCCKNMQKAYIFFTPLLSLSVKMIALLFSAFKNVMHIMILWYIFIAYRVVYLILNVTHFPKRFSEREAYPFPLLFLLFSSLCLLWTRETCREKRRAIKFFKFAQVQNPEIYSISFFYVSHSEPPPEKKGSIHHHYHIIPF